jgi:hypothetical protein
MKNTLILFFIITQTFLTLGQTKKELKHNKNGQNNLSSIQYNSNLNSPVLKTVLPIQIMESSGLIYTDGKLWTHNDKGGSSCIFSIDTSTGKVLQTVYIDNYPNTDWEDITADKNYIYIGDFGNNYGMRSDLRVLKIAKTSITDKQIIHANAEAIFFSYADQTNFSKSNRNNFDCESIISKNNFLYLFTKNRGDNNTRVYKLSKSPGAYNISSFTSFNAAGRVCGASYNDQTNELALIGYMNTKNNSFLWILDNFQNDQFFSGNKKRIEIGNSRTNWKTEGIAYEKNNRLFISCESSPDVRGSLFVYEIPKK